MSALSIITTSDGSHTIRNESTGDTYHSIHGAIQESDHVFIRSGLQYFFGLSSAEKVRILEVGFGTGLNALLTLQAIENKNVCVEYFTVEPFPLSSALFSNLNYTASENSYFKLLHEAPWETSININNNFSLTKIKSTVQEVELQNNFFNVVYYDAFAPNSQPEMWTLDVFRKLKNLAATPSVFVTYCAKGQVKRDLKTAGFLVESIPGPPGKREMVRARLV